MQTQEAVKTAEKILTVTDVTIIGVLLFALVISLIANWQFWKLNKELNLEARGFIEKYYVISTKLLSYISKGKDV